MAIQYLKSAELKNKTVLLRPDVNGRLDEQGNLADDFRVRSVLPTVEFLRQQNCKIIICGHFRRPKGEWKMEFSLGPVARKFAELLKLDFAEAKDGATDFPDNHVVFVPGDIRKEHVRKQIGAIPASNIVVLENLRFYPGEDANDPFFAQQLASLAEIYVDDAFGNAHRNAASMVAVTKYLPSYGGLLMEKEIKDLESVMHRPKKPFVLLMGGIKISDKAETLQTLGQKADFILVGGGIANILLKARGYEIGKSKIEDEAMAMAAQIDRNFKPQLVLPVDVVVANEQLDKSSIRAADAYTIKKDEVIYDLGPKTILAYAKILNDAKTIVWGGPLGFFEHKPFDTATMALAKVIGGVGRGRAFTVVGGGETVDAVRKAGQEEFIDHVSTGGGAMLEFLAGKKLPALEALGGAGGV
jgi:phosphoglycerate kinase